MIREEERAMAGASIVAMATMSCLGGGPHTVRARELIRHGVKMMGLDPSIADQMSAESILIPAAELLLARFAPVDAVMEG